MSGSRGMLVMPLVREFVRAKSPPHPHGVAAHAPGVSVPDAYCPDGLARLRPER